MIYLKSLWLFVTTANLVEKIADDTNTAIENQGRKVEELASGADLAEDRARKLVEKIG